eukprot:g1751.t1
MRRCPAKSMSKEALGSIGPLEHVLPQVHTTGMDILAAPCAKAVLTVGKDMNFRDYAQGAFRMRKVGKGQCIHLLVIPEVQTRIVAELGGSGQLILDVPKWLLLNSCRPLAENM